MLVAATPLISVVIPCYNQGRFLSAAIASARSSSLDVEVVVVDDGSTDDTPDVARRQEGIIYVRQPNRGLAAARNAGLEKSRGELIVFLDADDALAPGALDAGVAALRDRPECALATGRCVMMDADGTHLPTARQPPIDGDAYVALLRENYIWMPAMAMFRRQAILEAGGFDPSADAAADYDLYLRVARRWPVHDHGEVVAFYRQHGSNMSANAARMLRETLQVHARERRRSRLTAVQHAAMRAGRRRWQEFYGDRLVEEVRAHVRAGDWRAAAAKAAVLARHHPRGLLLHARRKMRVWLTRRRAARGSA